MAFVTRIGSRMEMASTFDSVYTTVSRKPPLKAIVVSTLLDPMTITSILTRRRKLDNRTGAKWKSSSRTYLALSFRKEFVAEWLEAKQS